MIHQYFVYIGTYSFLKVKCLYVDFMDQYKILWTPYVHMIKYKNIFQIISNQKHPLSRAYNNYNRF
eukprot:UN28170